MSEIEKHESGVTQGVMLTIKQIAQRLQVAEDTVYKHWRELGGFKVGGSIRFDWERTRERLFKGAEQEEKLVLSIYGGRAIPPGRRIPDPKIRKGRRIRGSTIFERIPDRHGLLGGLSEISGSGGSKKSMTRERR